MYIEVVKDTECPTIGKVHYLPHHTVIRHDKETTKLRIVYDASARSGGPSLNYCLCTGPKFDQKILDILLRLRSYRVALTTDIEKAFLMISMASCDRDVVFSMGQRHYTRSTRCCHFEVHLSDVWSFIQSFSS